ncbi:MAG: type II toxin-antitoxin system death-on-curing family toxin [Methylococcales bacterium]|jgi:death on curing protein|nr:MAG: type II toxin-antitoxin system death-on-curing family toxin [Methylococcales bacterium]
MTPLFFISKPLALKIHQQQIERFGGIEGIRDNNLLESALGAAQQTWNYTQDVYESAAQYCYSIAHNHPFLDGNKRTAAACMLVFLVKNHIKPMMNNTQLYDWVIAVATNQLQRTELAELLKLHCEIKASK